MKKKILFFLLFTSCLCLAVEKSDSGISLVPHGLLFRPLAANPFEPRLGTEWEGGKNALRLDIGNSVDLMRYAGDGFILTMGADFLTYTLLRGEQHLHFPVDAVDYLFGMNFNFKMPSTDLTSRLRVSHVSAHFADGHFEGTLGAWRGNRNPVVYSREFIDVVCAFEPPDSATRFYLGGGYILHLDPDYLGRTSFSAGGEYHTSPIARVQLYAAYQLSLLKIRSYSIRHNFQGGVKLGEWYGRGVKIFLSYFSGYSIQGEYFDQKEHYVGFGFTIEP